MKHPRDNEVSEHYKKELRERIEKDHPDLSAEDKQALYTSGIEGFFEGRAEGFENGRARAALLKTIGNEYAKHLFSHFMTSERIARLEKMGFDIDIFKAITEPLMECAFVAGGQTESNINKGITQISDLIKQITE